MVEPVLLALACTGALAIGGKIRDKVHRSCVGINLEIKPVSKPDQAAKQWIKPELVKLGALKDVAGGNPNPTQNVNNS